MNKDKILDNIFLPRKTNFFENSPHSFISVEDGVEVSYCSYIKNKSYDNIIFFHGNAELACEYNQIATFYNDLRINLIVADYRGYGFSGGSPTKENLLTDSCKVFEHIKDNLIARGFNGKKIIMGRSLGSASVWEIAENSSKSFDACIIESGFATETTLLPLLGVTADEIKFTLSDGFQNLRKIKKFTKPLLIIHAKNDHIVPLSEGKLAYKSVLSKNKKIIVADQADHNNIIYCMGKKYFKTIRSFIDSI